MPDIAHEPEVTALPDVGWEQDARPETSLPDVPGIEDAGDAVAGAEDAVADTIPVVDTPVAPVPNEGWIGGPCDDVGDCSYEDALCLRDDFPGGLCSLPCDRLCPDSDDPRAAITFCVDLGGSAGRCVSRCDTDLYPDSGCREGYACIEAVRFGESWTTRLVCVPPGLLTPPDPPDCGPDDRPLVNDGLAEPPGVDGCPAGMAPLPDGSACIDVYEAFLVELTAGGERPWSPYAHPGDQRVAARSAPGAVPQGYVTGVQAAAACAEAGKRLCTPAEWEFACRGPREWEYPYGRIREPGRCNDARSQHPVIEYFGTAADWIWSELGHPCINQLPDSLAPAGAHAGCVTPEGIFDLMGNLHEWVDDANGTFRGGYYVDTVINGEGCHYATTAHNVHHWDYSTGFRCCAGR